jgi:(p)ppGpp synthase/HD superfamily hydrolase
LARLSNTNLVIKAANFAAFKHRNQRRKDADASPYINHPLALAKPRSWLGILHKERCESSDPRSSIESLLSNIK